MRGPSLRRPLMAPHPLSPPQPGMRTATPVGDAPPGVNPPHPRNESTYTPCRIVRDPVATTQVPPTPPLRDTGQSLGGGVGGARVHHALPRPSGTPADIGHGASPGGTRSTRDSPEGVGRDPHGPPLNSDPQRQARGLGPPSHRSGPPDPCYIDPPGPFYVLWGLAARCRSYPPGYTG